MLAHRSRHWYVFSNWRAARVRRFVEKLFRQGIRTGGTQDEYSHFIGLFRKRHNSNQTIGPDKIHGWINCTVEIVAIVRKTNENPHQTNLYKRLLS